MQGAQLVFSRWTALQMAVQYEWGGPDSQEKYEWLFDETIDLFSKRGTKIDLDDLLDLFDGVLDAEFQVIADDGSAEEVSNTLLALFHECIYGKTVLLEQLKSLQSPPPVIIPPAENLETDSSGDEESLESGSEN